MLFCDEARLTSEKGCLESIDTDLDARALCEFEIRLADPNSLEASPSRYACWWFASGLALDASRL